MVNYPNWLDHRAIAIEAGDITLLHGDVARIAEARTAQRVDVRHERPQHVVEHDAALGQVHADEAQITPGDPGPAALLAAPQPGTGEVGRRLRVRPELGVRHPAEVERRRVPGTQLRCAQSV